MNELTDINELKPSQTFAVVIQSIQGDDFFYKLEEPVRAVAEFAFCVMAPSTSLAVSLVLYTFQTNEQGGIATYEADGQTRRVVAETETLAENFASSKLHATMDEAIFAHHEQIAYEAGVRVWQ